MSARIRLAMLLGTGLLACGGRVLDDARSEDAPQAPRTGIGAERPMRDGSRPPPSFSGGASEGRPQLPRAPLGGEAAPTGEASGGAPAPSPPPGTSPSDFGCIPGASRCSGARVESCSPEGRWLVIEQCSVLALCDATLGRCLSGCIPGETRCNGARVEQCNADATAFETIAECKSAGLCLGDSDGAACVNACEPGETRCIGPGPELGRCNDELTGFDIVEACSVRCDAVLCGPSPSADAGPEAPGASVPVAPPSAEPVAPTVDPVEPPSVDPGEPPSVDPIEPPPADPGVDAGTASGASAAAE